MQQHEDLFEDLPKFAPTSPEPEQPESTPLLLEPKEVEPVYEEIQDIAHELENDDSLSLEKKEKEAERLKSLLKGESKQAASFTLPCSGRGSNADSVLTSHFLLLPIEML